MKEIITKMKKLAAVPIKNDGELRRVEIIMLKFKEAPEVIDKAISRIIHNTDHPFKLTIFDNRPNCANTSRIWNKLTAESTCDYVLIIDSDAFVPVRKEGEKCWLTVMMERIDETGIVIPVSSSPGGAHQHVSGPKEYPSWRINKDIWSGYCFLFNKNISRNYKFDELYYIYGSDSEWAHRTAKAFRGAVMCEDVFVEHIGGYSFKKDPDREDDKAYARELFKYHSRTRNA